jgi:hypothetical protein
LQLVVAEHGEVVDVVGGGAAFEYEPAVCTVVHSAGVVRFQLEGVDDGRLVAVVEEVWGEAFWPY